MLYGLFFLIGSSIFSGIDRELYKGGLSATSTLRQAAGIQLRFFLTTLGFGIVPSSVTHLAAPFLPSATRFKDLGQVQTHFLFSRF